MDSKKKWEELMYRREFEEPQLQIVEETVEPTLSDKDRHFMSLPIERIEALLQLIVSSDSKDYIN